MQQNLDFTLLEQDKLDLKLDIHHIQIDVVQPIVDIFKLQAASQNVTLMIETKPCESYRALCDKQRI